jgi:hypothetical protein
MLKRPDDPPPPDRHKRFRRRRKAGKACYTVELGCEELEFLLRNLWITEAEICDRKAVGRAIGAMISDAARR